MGKIKLPTSLILFIGTAQRPEYIYSSSGSKEQYASSETNNRQQHNDPECTFIYDGFNSFLICVLSTKNIYAQTIDH